LIACWETNFGAVASGYKECQPPEVHGGQAADADL
jgi:hypothetical protein